MKPFRNFRRAVILLSLSITLHGQPTNPDHYANRDLLVFAPRHLPAPGTRALVIVLHGGLGNAQRIATGQSESALNLNAIAEQNGFLVAYLNGTPVTRLRNAPMLGWNAGGGCCGQPAATNVDDVAYITGAIAYLTKKYAIDPTRIYAIGHSNGAMMAQRLICETNVFAAAIAISGPLNLPVETCPTAHGKRILAIHGADDANVPIAGGRGTKGLAQTAYQSEAHSQQILTRSGATYTLQIVPGADHELDHIDAAIQRSEGISIPQKAAKFFSLAP